MSISITNIALPTVVTPSCSPSFSFAFSECVQVISFIGELCWALFCWVLLRLLLLWGLVDGEHAHRIVLAGVVLGVAVGHLVSLVNMLGQGLE